MTDEWIEREAGYDINAFDDRSKTPLHYAVANDHLIVAQWRTAFDHAERRTDPDRAAANRH